MENPPVYTASPLTYVAGYDSPQAAMLKGAEENAARLKGIVGLDAIYNIPISAIRWGDSQISFQISGKYLCFSIRDNHIDVHIEPAERLIPPPSIPDKMALRFENTDEPSIFDRSLATNRVGKIFKKIWLAHDFCGLYCKSMPILSFSAFKIIGKDSPLLWWCDSD